ncbi:hypothetical protein P152DRAFT_451318 [Eremomyces bilateralis CBS 781.70]|uniref:C2H2-type domain-containing protein n=1 Tax=Eremomyces bilateralis CBS 781.70 TaxID=1392243 RepID=A0A6G1FWR2_9PEZI|nr:uncharacterized protein P152DRAFT_451318 [Eremomyces bilateralis CBS 781.70]KAF1810223.1 hypothetical protein P152DRAFT_451318 [Eremomyces bilateralis CBS 781.70]
MAIPNAFQPPPPPLPPPRFVPQLQHIHIPDPHRVTDFGSDGSPSVKAGSSLLGGFQFSRNDRCGSIKGHDLDDSPSTAPGASDRDMAADKMSESEGSLPNPDRPRMASYSLQSEQQLGRQAVANSSQNYDRHLLSKIGNPNTPSRNAAPPLFGSNTSPHNVLDLKPLALPERRHSAVDSPLSRWPSAPSSGISPGTTSFRSPLSEHAPDGILSGRHHSFSVAPDAMDDVQSSDSRSHRGADDHHHSIFMDQDMEDGGMQDLNLHDRSPSSSEESQTVGKCGVKRRADGPPGESSRDDKIPMSASELFSRRPSQLSGLRASPYSRIHVGSGSISSGTSSVGQRIGSYGSSWGLSVASSVTSYGGNDQKLSPSALSPSGEGELGVGSPFSRNKSANTSPRGSLSQGHQRHPSESEAPRSRKHSADQTNAQRRDSATKNQGQFICECCPKKPKKFDSQEELQVHALEKQYQCQYCPNRFKNKNEAERHQNSLHLRRHSWSCAALAGVHAAFHVSSANPSAADVCGYCGEEFPHPINWDARREHLHHVHKFGDCNQAKKFFRADHFRQHLKHSHAGTSGKWTNMLENSCMKDEPPPIPTTSVMKERNASIAGGSPGSVSMNGSSVPSVIDEAMDES